MDPAVREEVREAIQAQGVALGRTMRDLAETGRSAEAAQAMAHEAHRLATAAVGQVTLGAPELYLGESDRLEGFLSHLRLKFELEPANFSSERARVLFCLTRLGGHAKDWAIAEFTQQAECVSTFDKLAEELTLMFNPAALRRITASRWFHLSQGRRSVLEYALEFRTLAARLKYPEVVQCDKFYDGLSDRLKDELAGQKLPGELRKVIELVAALDQRFQARAFERGNPLRRPMEGSAVPHRAPSAGRSREQHAPAADVASSFGGRARESLSRSDAPPSPLSEEPMELGQYQLDRRELQRRRSSGLCLTCGQGGHWRSTCRLNPNARQRTERR